MTNMTKREVRKSIATLLLALLPVQTFATPAPQTGSRPAQRPAQSTIQRTPQSNAVTTLAFFGPRKYVRTTGPKDVYTATVAVPAWLKPPFRLFVQNGEPDGTFDSGLVNPDGSKRPAYDQFAKYAKRRLK